MCRVHGVCGVCDMNGCSIEDGDSGAIIAHVVPLYFMDGMRGLVFEDHFDTYVFICGVYRDGWLVIEDQIELQGRV